MSSTILEAGGERNDQSLRGHPDERLASGPGSRPSAMHEAGAPDGETDLVHARTPAPQQRAPNEPPIVESPPLHDDRQPEGDESGNPSRGSPLRRHKLALMLGLVLFIPAAAAGYLYWDSAGHFQSTDDAFIAAR